MSESHCHTRVPPSSPMSPPMLSPATSLHAPALILLPHGDFPCHHPSDSALCPLPCLGGFFPCDKDGVSSHSKHPRQGHLCPTSDRDVSAVTVSGGAHHSSHPRDLPGQAEQSSARKSAMEPSSISNYLLPAALQEKNLKTPRKRFSSGAGMMSGNVGSCSPTGARCHTSPMTHIPHVVPA